MRIYICSPYTPHSESRHDCIKEATGHVEYAVRMGIKLLEMGHHPFIPHLTHYVWVNPKCPYFPSEVFYEWDNTFLMNWAEAILYLGESKGTIAELELAKKFGLVVFTSIDDVPEANEE